MRILGKTYFFKNKVFWEFNDRRMRVTSATPSLSAPYWMGCPNGMHHDHADLRPAEGHYKVNGAAAQRTSAPIGFVVALWTVLVLFILNE